MKTFVKVLMAIATILLASLSLGVQAITCPSLNTIRAISFTQAEVIGGQASNVWVLTSDDFDHEGDQWNLSLVIYPLKANSPEIALQKGQTFFNKLPLHESTPIKNPRNITCGYGEDLMQGVYFSVLAETPPDRMDYSDKLLRVKSIK